MTCLLWDIIRLIPQENLQQRKSWKDIDDMTNEELKNELAAFHNRVGIRLKLRKDALIKVLDYCIRIYKKLIRKKSDFHACDFLGLEALQLTGLCTRALGPASWTTLDMKKHAHESPIFV